ncbi:MAG TPA: hypothetical protein VFJ09_00375 [Nocardioidaceae bacterium]|nr:hypothetical protein [Nocardioidaceae bacterium]
MRGALVQAVAVALLAALGVGCDSGPSASPSPPPSPVSPPAGQSRPDCTTSAAQGRCGPYDAYPRITGTTSSTYVGNNVWSPVDGSRQTLAVTNPGQWTATANIPDGNTSVVSYPSVGANYGRITNEPTPLTDYSSLNSSFSEAMHPTPRTSAWATYDIWLGQNHCSPSSTTNCASYEVMIQHDFANNGACSTRATASFGGSKGVPVQRWHLCTYGSELIWKLGGDDEHKISESSGSVDILAMLTWLVDHRYLPEETGLWLIGYGWEICSTGGSDERFAINDFSLTPTISR